MKGLRSVSVALAIVLVGLLAYTVSGRLFYPFELEWMEGATVIHVSRLLSGEGIYVRPSLAFVPFGYPALYYYLCLPFAWLIGPGFTALRLVSICATVGSLLGTYAIVRHRSGAAAGVAAAGLFAGAYALSDAWYDLGRVDAVYVALLGAVYLVAARASAPASWAVCGLLAAAAFATKQPAVLAVAPLGLYLLITDRRAALAFGGTFVAVAAGTFIAFNAATDGWYRYYIVDVPRLRMDVSPRGERALSFWTEDLLPVWPALAAGAVAIFLNRAWRDAALIGGFVAAGWSARLEGGAWNNAVMPAYFAAAILLGLSLQQASRWSNVWWSVAAVQLGLLLYDPRPFRPTAEQRARGHALIEELRTLPMPVLMMSNGAWATTAGLSEHAHGWAVTDVVWADRGETGQQLEREIEAAIRDRAFATIVTDGQRSWFNDHLQNYYRPLRSLDAPPPPSGAPRRPAAALQRR